MHYSKLWTLALSLTLFLALPLLAAIGPSKAKPLPAPEMAASALPSVDDAVRRLYVSHRFAADGALVESGSDISDYELRALQEFREGNGAFAWAKAVPAKRREIWLLRYHLTDERIIEELAAAKSAGYGQVFFVTDLNDALDAGLTEGDEPSTAFSKAAYRDSPLGRAIEKLRELGFRYNGKTAGIYSHPLYPRGGDDRVPLMHEKSLLLVTRGAGGKVERAVHIGGTANLAIHARAGAGAAVTRYNRAIEVVDPAATQRELAHAEKLVEGFGAGKPIHEIESLKPLRITYPNGELMELAYSDGRFNPNDRIADLFDRAAKAPAELEIQRVILSHFVLTNGRVVKAMEAAMKAQPKFSVFGIFDDRFIDLRGFGLATGLDGFDILKPFGQVDFGVGEKIEDRTDLYGYQRGIPGVGETDLDGPPTARHVWHDKTTVVLVKEKGVQKGYVFTGSFNCSGNFHNAERQTMFVLRETSPLLKATIDSIINVVRDEPDYALPLPDAVMRNGVAALIGHSDLEIPLASNRLVVSHLRAKDFNRVENEIRRLAAIPTTLAKKVPDGVVDERISAFRRFLDWHGEEMPHVYLGDKDVGLRKLINIAVILATPEMAPRQARDALRSALWDVRAPDDEELRAKRVEKAWALLGLGGQPPARAQAASGGCPWALRDRNLDYVDREYSHAPSLRTPR